MLELEVEMAAPQAWMRRVNGCVRAGRFEDSGVVRCCSQDVEVEKKQRWRRVLRRLGQAGEDGEEVVSLRGTSVLVIKEDKHKSQ
jgi:hypothetical protein